MKESSSRVFAALLLAAAHSAASAQTSASQTVTIENYNRAQTDVDFAGVVHGVFWPHADRINSEWVSFLS